MMKSSSLLVMALWGGLFAALPGISVAQPQVLVHIETNDASAAVYADSVYLGLASGSPYWVDHDTDVIRLSTLRAAAWSVSPLREQLIATPGDTVLVTLNFPMYHRIESHPFGAEAWLQEGSERSGYWGGPLWYLRLPAFKMGCSMLKWKVMLRAQLLPDTISGIVMRSHL